MIGPGGSGGSSVLAGQNLDQDPRNGDLLYCDVQFATNGVIKRIIYSTNITGR